MPDRRIDVVITGGKKDASAWHLGSVLSIANDIAALKNAIDQVIAASTAEWILFWDFSMGEPDEDLIRDLATKPVDVFHAGLKMGLKGLPEMLNYIHPTWMYNVDAPETVTHSNFRLSFNACMIRTATLKKSGNISTAYTSWHMAGLAYGYKLLKQGSIIRYHSALLHKYMHNAVEVSLKDEWVFARQFFTAKWHFWILLNKEKKTANLINWLATRHVPYVKHDRIIHASVKTDSPVEYKTVSVLAPTLDRYPYLEEELRELNKQNVLPHEILITDQTDIQRRQDIDFSKYNKLNVRYFPQEEKGQCLAWNKLIAEATGEYIFFFGDDAYDIQSGLIEKMLQTMQRFDADMVASNVREKGITYRTINHHYYLSDTFPITLIKKSVVVAAGGMDMFFNRNVKADHDLAMRCHLNGALMIFDPSAEIGHHRAPSGGLRTHNARVITNFMAKNTISKVLNPSASEIFIYKKYYTEKQFLNHVRIKYMNQVVINGSLLKKILRLFVLLYKIPQMRQVYKANLKTADDELAKRNQLTS